MNSTLGSVVPLAMFCLSNADVYPLSDADIYRLSNARRNQVVYALFGEYV